MKRDNPQRADWQGTCRCGAGWCGLRVDGCSGERDDQREDRHQPNGTDPAHADRFLDLTAQHTMAANSRMSVTAAPRILIVDDTPALIDVVRKCLEQEGYHVRTCLESRNAVRIARADPPDVIMLDVVMPEVSGWQVLAALREDAASYWQRRATLPWT